jgi:hypothetical protein
VHDVAVSYGNIMHVLFLGFCNQAIDSYGAVEQGVIGVNVKVDKSWLAHGDYLRLWW